jgi:hypothetical protein
VLRTIRSALRTGGLLLLATGDGDQEGAVSEWLGTPMFFSARRAADVSRIVSEAGFDVISAEVETQREGAVEIPYLWLLASRIDDQPG